MQICSMHEGRFERGENMFTEKENSILDKAEDVIHRNNELLHMILVSRGFSDADARTFVGFAKMIGLLEQWKDSIKKVS